MAKLVVPMDAACVEAVTVAASNGLILTRSANDSSQYRIAWVTRPEIRDAVTGCSTTNSGWGARLFMRHAFPWKLRPSTMAPTMRHAMGSVTVISGTHMRCDDANRVQYVCA